MPAPAKTQLGRKRSTNACAAALGTTVNAAGASASQSARMPNVRPQVYAVTVGVDVPARSWGRNPLARTEQRPKCPGEPQREEQQPSAEVHQHPEHDTWLVYPTGVLVAAHGERPHRLAVGEVLGLPHVSRELGVGATHHAADPQHGGGGCERDGVFSLRPEKIRLLAPGATAPAGFWSATGTLSDLVYAGMMSRYTVALDGGGSLVLAAQNLATSARDTGAERGRAVTIAWDPAHSRPLVAG